MPGRYFEYWIQKTYFKRIEDKHKVITHKGLSDSYDGNAEAHDLTEGFRVGNVVTMRFNTDDYEEYYISQVICAIMNKPEFKVTNISNGDKSRVIKVEKIQQDAPMPRL